MKARTIIAAAMLLLSASVSAGDLLAGDAARIWLMRAAPDGKTCGVFSKELGISWRLIARNQTAVPTAAVAAAESLHMFYADRQHVVIDSAGQMRVASNLPGDLIACCSGEGLGGAETAGSAVFALVLRNEPPSSPTSQPTTAPTTTPATKSPYECLYRSSGNDWSLVAYRPLPEKANRTDEPAFPAVLKGRLYVLTRREGDDPNRPYVLRRYNPAPEGQASWADVHLWPADQAPVGMTAIKNRLLVVHRTAVAGATTAPVDISLTITRYAPAGRSPFTSLPIMQNQAVVHWPAEAPKSVSRLGEQLALLWQDGEAVFSALCTPGGAMDSPENITKTIENMPDIELANELFNYFLLSVVVVIGMGMFFRRLRTSPRPFLLAAGLVPGNLLKRLLAAAIDFLPFYFLVGVFFLPRNVHFQTVQQFIENPQSASPELLVSTMYTLMFSMGLYVVYGTILEMRFGATPGKILLRLRAVREDGRKPGLREALLRNATKVIELSMLLSSMAWLMMIFVLLPLLTRNRQRLGDMVARSAVVEAGSLEALREKNTDVSSAPPNQDDDDDAAS
ncbi:MAG: RDD family protein [Phycisphaerae bacterium]|nr:RDD family protein [Phycisphaerae bacterium]